MTRSRVFWIGFVFLGIVFAFLTGLPSRFADRNTERWFVPGEIGHEYGRSTEVPTARAFLTRAMSGVARGNDEEWARHNHLTKPLAFSHNLGNVFPAELFQRHPEYFPLADGHRLQPVPRGPIFWNPDLGRMDVAAFAADVARQQFQAHPEQESFALGVNDGLIFGESPETLALVTPTRWFRERPDYAPLVFTFTNRAADELARTHPQKLLGALAYYWAEDAPDFRLNSQIVPFLTSDRAQGYNENFRQEEFRLQDRWGQVGTKRLGLYDYLYGGGFLIPRIHTKLLAENLRHARRAGFTDYYAEVNPNWGLDGPMPWLAAQLLQDPEQPAPQLLDEYYQRYFKEAADSMRRFFEVCEERWMGQPGPPYWLKHYRNESQAILFPSDICRQLRGLLNQASQAKEEIVRRRVKLVSDAFGVTERFVAFKEARDRVARMGLVPGTDWKVTLSALKVYLSARREFIRYTMKLQLEELLAMTRFGWDDYLKNDPVADVLLTVKVAATARGEGTEADAMLRSWSEPLVSGLWQSFSASSSNQEKELLRNCTFAGLSLPARRIAGLEYGVALPGEWASQVEPVQYHHAELLESGGTRVLRISGSKDTSVSQWDPVGGTGLHRASVSVRGHVSPGTIVSLTFGWLDRKENHVGFKSLRLPDGDWPEWVTLQQAGLPPAGSVWVGMGLRVQNQVAGDWVEAREFHLRASP